MIRVALVQVVGGVGGGRCAAAQCSPPGGRVRAGGGRGAEGDLGGLPGATRAPQGTLKHLTVGG